MKYSKEEKQKRLDQLNALIYLAKANDNKEEKERLQNLRRVTKLKFRM